MFRYLVPPIAMASIFNIGYTSPNLNFNETHLEDSAQEKSSEANKATNIDTPLSTNDNSKTTDPLPKQQLDGVQPPENLKHTNPVNTQNSM